MLGKDIHIDEYLVSRLKNGDEQAFREVFRQFHKPMYEVALKYLKDGQQAEDALQDVFLKLWLNRHKLDEELSIKGFLFTALKNHLLNLIRNRKVETTKQADLKLNTINVQNDVEAYVEMHEYESHITHSLNKLSPQRQVILKMRIYRGLTNQEISQQLNISINTVKFQLSQATKMLREYLKQSI